MVDNLAITPAGGHIVVTAGYNVTLSNNFLQHFTRTDSASISFATYETVCNPQDNHLQQFLIVNNTFEYTGDQLLDSVGLVSASFGTEFGLFHRKQLYKIKGNYFNVRKCKCEWVHNHF